MRVRLRLALSVAFSAIVLLLELPPPGEATVSEPTASRRFAFVYEVEVPPLAAEGPFRLWLPLPPNDTYQEISELTVESPFDPEIQTEPEYGNRFAYFEVAPEDARPGFKVRLSFTALRHEHRVDPHALAQASDRPASPAPELSRFLAPDHLVPIDGAIAALAREQTAGARTPEEKARRIYDYVVSTMRYDKSGDGWGRGDAVWACSSKRGNCTDFHSLLIGMMRASGIPARFEIGFPLPADRTQSDIPGYHCWAEFYLDGVGWVPVDASEAAKNPARRDYFFGAHDDNRVLFTSGRDLRLGPQQRGAPLNYFIYPYAELGDRPYGGIEKRFRFREIEARADAPDREGASSARGAQLRPHLERARAEERLLVPAREPGSRVAAELDQAGVVTEVGLRVVRAPHEASGAEALR